MNNILFEVRNSEYWNSLKHKHENNVKLNEFNLYQYLSEQCSLLALRLNLNHLLCEKLSQIYGFTFCNYGNSGWKLIKEYFKKINIDIDINKIKANITKEEVKTIEKEIDEQFLKYIDELFSETPQTKEVKLVLGCYRILKTLQPIMDYNLNEYYHLVDLAINELQEKMIELNDIELIDLEKYIPNDMPILSKIIINTEEEQFILKIDNIYNEIKNTYKDLSLEEIAKISIERFLIS
jgi:hypothetical protein